MELEFIGNELLQTLYTWDQVADIAKEVVTSTSLDLSGTYSTILRIPNNFSSPASQPVLDEIQALSDEIATILSPTGHRYRDAGDLIWKNKDYIADEAVGYIQDKYTKDIAGTLTDFLIMPGNGAPAAIAIFPTMLSLQSSVTSALAVTLTPRRSSVGI